MFCVEPDAGLAFEYYTGKEFYFPIVNLSDKKLGRPALTIFL